MNNGNIGPGFTKKVTDTGAIASDNRLKIVIVCAIAVIVLFVVLFATGVIGGGQGAETGIDDGDFASVPAIVGEHYENAIRLAEKADMLFVITGKHNNETIELNHIFSQDPRAKASAPIGSALLGIVSGGAGIPGKSEGVPDVLFLTEEEAIALLESAGIPFRLGYVESDNILDGLVASTSKTPGNEDADIEISISTGSDSQDDALAKGAIVDLIDQIADNRGERYRSKEYLDILYAPIIKKYNAAVMMTREELMAEYPEEMDNWETAAMLNSMGSLRIGWQYAYYDLDGDGIPELIAGEHMAEGGAGVTSYEEYNKSFGEVYKLEKNLPIMIYNGRADGTNTTKIASVGGENFLYFRYESGPVLAYDIFKLTDNGLSVEYFEGFRHLDWEDGEEGFIHQSQDFQVSDRPLFPAPGINDTDETQISFEEYQALVDKYTNADIELDWFVCDPLVYEDMDVITVTGIIKKIVTTHPGNGEELTGHILYLEDPIIFKTIYAELKRIDEIHVWYPESDNSLDNYTDIKVSVTGEAMSGHTSYHLREMLLRVDSIDK